MLRDLFIALTLTAITSMPSVAQNMDQITSLAGIKGIAIVVEISPELASAERIRAGLNNTIAGRLRRAGVAVLTADQVVSLADTAAILKIAVRTKAPADGSDQRPFSATVHLLQSGFIERLCQQAQSESDTTHRDICSDMVRATVTTWKRGDLGLLAASANRQIRSVCIVMVDEFVAEFQAANPNLKSKSEGRRTGRPGRKARRR